MFSFTERILTLYLIGTVISAPSFDFTPCEKSHSNCLTDTTKLLYRKLIEGDAAKGVPKADPLYVEEIDGKFSEIHYRLMNNTFRGVKDCEIYSAELSEHKTHVTIKLDCPKLELSGNYTLDGHFKDMPLQGEGNYTEQYFEYALSIQSDIQRTTKDDGKTYMSLEKIDITADLTGGINFDLANLYGGNKTLADAANKLISENWKLIMDSFQTPILLGLFGKMFEHLNILLKDVPVDNFVYQD